MPSPHTVLDHVALGVPAIAPVAAFVVGELGGHARGSGPGFGFLWWQWEYAGGGALEILEPAGPKDGFLFRFLAARGPGPHHVTFKVPDIRDAMARAQAAGHDVVGFDDRDPGWIEAFLHPKRAQGIVVQIVQAAESDGDDDGDWERPAYPETAAAPPPPARFVGLHTRSQGEERARAQWETLLGGAWQPRPDGGVLTWPDSPLRVRVEVSPHAPEGPVALEFAADRALTLPEGPHPLFGIPFRQIEE